MPTRFKYTKMARKQGLSKAPVSKKTVKKMISRNQETKIYQISLAAVTGGNVWTINPLSDMATGDLISNREGNTVSPIALKARIRMAVNAANTLGEEIRVVFIKDKQARGVVPTVAQLGLADDATGNLVQMKDITNFYSRFQILSDKTYSFDTSQRIRTVKQNLKLSGKMKFGTDGNDYEDNALFVALWSQNNTNKASIDIVPRLFFKDG